MANICPKPRRQVMDGREIGREMYRERWRYGGGWLELSSKYVRLESICSKKGFPFSQPVVDVN